jgi:hypothetical protein
MSIRHELLDEPWTSDTINFHFFTSYPVQSKHLNTSYHLFRCGPSDPSEAQKSQRELRFGSKQTYRTVPAVFERQLDRRDSARANRWKMRLP